MASLLPEKGKIVRQCPMVPGIDFAGQVLESTDARYKAGDKVVLTGWGWVKATGAAWQKKRELMR